MIKKIELKNFKCFESLELPLGNLNLLSGINSMGKSTIIQSLLLLRQAFERGSIQEGVYLNGIYTQIGTGHDLLYFNADGNIEIKLTDEKGDEFDWHLEYSRDSDYLYVQGDPMRGEKEAFENNKVMENFYWSRITQRMTSKKGQSVLRRKWDISLNSS